MDEHGHAGLLADETDGVVRPVHILALQVGGVALTGAQMPAKLVEQFAFGVHFRGKDSQGQQPQATESEEDQKQESDEQPSRACRYCQGTLHLTNTTYRPKVSEILVMPLQWFLEARAGAIVTLSEKAKERAKLLAETEGQLTAESSREKNAETGREQAPWPIPAHW